ncbi:hypothetical protein Plhal304r1_c077g0164291 [Plasmopara halstedii]
MPISCDTHTPVTRAARFIAAAGVRLQALWCLAKTPQKLRYGTIVQDLHHTWCNFEVSEYRNINIATRLKISKFEELHRANHSGKHVCHSTMIGKVDVLESNILEGVTGLSKFSQ